MVAEIAIDINASAGMSRITVTVLAPEAILENKFKELSVYKPYLTAALPLTEVWVYS